MQSFKAGGNAESSLGGMAFGWVPVKVHPADAQSADAVAFGSFQSLGQRSFYRCLYWTVWEQSPVFGLFKDKAIPATGGQRENYSCGCCPGMGSWVETVECQGMTISDDSNSIETACCTG